MNNQDFDAPCFEINVGSLRTRLGFIGKAIGNVSIQPILSALRIQVDASTLQIASYNLDACIQIKLDADGIYLPATGPKTYVFCPPAKLLGEILSKLPGDSTVRISLTSETDHLVTIGCGGFVCTVQGFDPTSYPKLPTVAPEETSITRTLPLGEMRTGLEKVLYAVSPEETKQILTGVYCEFFTNGLRLSATDGHRIARTALLGIGEHKEMGELLYTTVLSKSVLDLLVAMPGSDDVQLYVKVEERRAEFCAAKVTASANLIIGQFPNLETVLNPPGKPWITSIRLERVQLLSAVERCQIVANGTENRVVVINAKTSKLILSAKSEHARVNEKMSCRLTMGKQIRFAFNSKYLFAALKAARSEIIDILLNNGTMGKIYCVDDPTHEQLIAQIQIREELDDRVEPEPEATPTATDESGEIEDAPSVTSIWELQDKPITPAMDTYLEFKKVYPNHLLLMRLGDFYESFGEDAITLSQATNLVQTTKLVAELRLPMSGMPHHALERFLPMITKAGHSAAVVDSGAVRLVEPESPESETPEEEEREFSLSEDEQQIYESLTIIPPSDPNFKQALKDASINALNAAQDFCNSVPDGNKTRGKQIQAQLKKLTIK